MCRDLGHGATWRVPCRAACVPRARSPLLAEEAEHGTGGWGRERGLGTEGAEASFWREGEQTLPRPGEPAPCRRGAAGRAGTLLPRVPGLTFHAQLAPRASFSSDLGRRHRLQPVPGLSPRRPRPAGRDSGKHTRADTAGPWCGPPPSPQSLVGRIKSHLVMISGPHADPLFQKGEPVLHPAHLLSPVTPFCSR